MLPRLDDLCRAQRGVFTRRQALACGYSADEIRARLRAGTWSRVRHGVYGVPGPLDERSRHLRDCYAALLVSSPAVSLTGPSACLVYGFASVAVPTSVFVTGNATRSARGVHVLRSVVGDARRTTVEGLRVVDPAAAVVAAAQVLPFEAAVVVADSALRSGVVNRGDLVAAVSEASRHVAATRVVRFADGRSESVGESLARVAIDAAGLPRPELQVEFVARSGRRYRVDFYWPEHRTIGEFDGRVKYAHDPDVLWHEKRREDDLRQLGHAVARFGARDIRERDELRAIVHRAFEQGDAFRG